MLVPGDPVSSNTASYADLSEVRSKYKLEKLKDIEDLVAEAVQVNIPFNVSCHLPMCHLRL